MKFIADCEARTRHRHATFSIKKSKLETVEECDEEGQCKLQIFDFYLQLKHF